MKVMKQRGSSELALTKLSDICDVHQLISLDLMEPIIPANRIYDDTSDNVDDYTEPTKQSHRPGGIIRSTTSSSEYISDHRLLTEEHKDHPTINVQMQPRLNESNSGLNDEAFESARKRTGKFTVEHLAAEEEVKAFEQKG